MPQLTLHQLTAIDQVRLFSLSRLSYMTKLANLADCIRHPAGPYFFNHPEAVSHILQASAKSFTKKKLTMTPC